MMLRKNVAPGCPGAVRWRLLAEAGDHEWPGRPPLRSVRERSLDSLRGAGLGLAKGLFWGLGPRAVVELLQQNLVAQVH